MFVFGNRVPIFCADSWLGTKSAQMFMKRVKSEKESQLLEAALSDLEAVLKTSLKTTQEKTAFLLAGVRAGLHTRWKQSADC